LVAESYQLTKLLSQTINCISHITRLILIKQKSILLRLNDQKNFKLKFIDQLNVVTHFD